LFLQGCKQREGKLTVKSQGIGPLGNQDDAKGRRYFGKKKQSINRGKEKKMAPPGGIAQRGGGGKKKNVGKQNKSNEAASLRPSLRDLQGE